MHSCEEILMEVSLQNTTSKYLYCNRLWLSAVFVAMYNLPIEHSLLPHVGFGFKLKGGMVIKSHFLCQPGSIFLRAVLKMV